MQTRGKEGPSHGFVRGKKTGNDKAKDVENGAQKHCVNCPNDRRIGEQLPTPHLSDRYACAILPRLPDYFPSISWIGNNLLGTRPSLMIFRIRATISGCSAATSRDSPMSSLRLYNSIASGSGLFFRSMF